MPNMSVVCCDQIKNVGMHRAGYHYLLAGIVSTYTDFLSFVNVHSSNVPAPIVCVLDKENTFSV